MKHINYLILLLFLMPRPPINNAEFLIYIVFSLIFTIVIILNLSKVKLGHQYLNNLVLLLLMTGIICLSIIFNGKSYSSLTSIAKIIFYVIIFTYSYIEGSLNTEEKLKFNILRTANLILIVEVIVSITQLLGVRVFHYIYSMDKTLPFGTLVRIAGTLENPNLFGWLITQLALIFFVLDKKTITSFFKIGLCFILVFFSGSRNSLVIFPIALFVTYVCLTKKNVSFFLKKLPLFLIILSILGAGTLSFLYKNQDKFPYMSQLFNVFESGSLSSVNSFSYRIMMWETAIEKFSESTSNLKYIFGLGPGTFEVLDNDYLYSFINFGFFFFLIQALLYIKSLFSFRRSTNLWLSALGIQYVILSLIIGFQSETISGWNYPILFFFYYGTMISHIKKGERSISDSNYLGYQKENCSINIKN